jgi:hypothetical protein
VRRRSIGKRNRPIDNLRPKRSRRINCGRMLLHRPIHRHPAPEGLTGRGDYVEILFFLEAEMQINSLYALKKCREKMITVQNSWRRLFGHDRACAPIPINCALCPPDRDRWDNPGDDESLPRFLHLKHIGTRLFWALLKCRVSSFFAERILRNLHLLQNVARLRHTSKTMPDLRRPASYWSHNRPMSIGFYPPLNFIKPLVAPKDR